MSLNDHFIFQNSGEGESSSKLYLSQQMVLQEFAGGEKKCIKYFEALQFQYLKSILINGGCSKQTAGPMSQAVIDCCQRIQADGKAESRWEVGRPSSSNSIMIIGKNFILFVNTLQGTNSGQSDFKTGVTGPGGGSDVVQLSKLNSPFYYIIILISEMPAPRNGDRHAKKGRMSKQRGEAAGLEKRNKSKAQSKRRFGYWRNSEQVKYLSFLKSNFLIMKNAQLRAEFQIFKKMSTFVRSRDAIQCKSHHQKMLMKNDNKLEAILTREITVADARPEYIYRQLRSDKLMREHLSKIQTNEELPYFMIKEPHSLLIVIDQRFMISY